MTQMSSRHFNRSSRPSHFLSKDKIIALISFLTLVIFACTTFVGYLFLPENENEEGVDGIGNNVDGDGPYRHKKLGVMRAIHHRFKHRPVAAEEDRIGNHREKARVREDRDRGRDSSEADRKPAKREQFTLMRKAVKEQYDEMLPTETEEDTERLRNFVNGIRMPKHEQKKEVKQQLSYDINNCPEEPPKHYPYEWPLLDILDNWRPNNITSTFRPGIYQALCRFDFETEMHKAEKYREAELPFLLRDEPRVLKVVERWNHEDYLSKLLGSEKFTAEYSETNSLMWFKMKQDSKRPPPTNWHQPMTSVRITYDEWVEKASQPEEDMGPTKPHWYFRVNAKGGNDHFMFNELPFFLPEKNFFIVEKDETRGINCRYGMLGNTAAAHFDGSRNFVILFGGERRYILSHPKNCPMLGLYPRSHPSGRHSAFDWSYPDLETYPEFANAMGNEVVLQAGDVLYLPTYWFHYIVSSDLNWQCNARSGITKEYQRHIDACGM